MKSSSQSRFGFTLIELLVVISIIALLIAILLPALGAARRVAGQMQNSTQLRGIHQGLVTFANDNNNHFAGLDSDGDIVPDGERTTGNSGEGATVEARYWILLDGDFFSPAYAISPAETAVEVTEYRESTTAVEPLTSDHYSYALLAIASRRNGPSQGRFDEWSQTLNSQAIVVSDRNLDESAPRSIHQSDAIEVFTPESNGNIWLGSVLWNDNHVAFEGTANAFFETRYGNGSLNPEDNLFGGADSAPGDAATENALLAAEGFSAFTVFGRSN